MSGMRPAAEPVYSISQSRSHFSEIGSVDLSDVAQAGHLGPGAGACNERFHLFRGEVLRLIQNDETIQKGSPTHEIQRADLDAIAQQVVRGGPAPGSAFLGAGQHL